MKKVDYKQVTTKKCIDCGKPLKANLINKNPTAKRCYKCHRALRQRKIDSRTV